MIEWYHWVIGFLLACFIVTALLRRFKNAETYLGLISLLKTKKPLPWFDRMAKRIGEPLNWFADAGLVLGFGAVAVDYLYCRKFSRKKRVVLFAVSTALLMLFFYFIDFLMSFGALRGLVSNNPLTMGQLPLFAFAFGIFGFAGFTLLSLAMLSIDIITKTLAGQKACPGVAPLIPGVQVPNVPFFVPLHAWLSLVIILIIHEFMHGIVARWQKFRVKSAGLLLFGFVPIGAFVEPDEKEIAVAEPRKALRVFSAGPTANLAAMIPLQIFMIIFIMLVAPLVVNYQDSSFDGVRITGVDQNIDYCGTIYANDAYGKIDGNVVVLQINDTNVKWAAQVARFELDNKNTAKFTLQKESDGNIFEVLLTPTELGTFGFEKHIENIPKENPNKESDDFNYSIVNFIFEFTFWLFLLNFMLALVNFLPVGVFDGGRITKIMMLPYFGFLGMNKEDTEKFIGRLFLWIVLALIMINALPLFIF